jgi:radical SAM/Cys-rich protein
MGLSTLTNRAHPLASASAQRMRLAALPLRRSFGDAVSSAGAGPLRAAAAPAILQMNLGKRCNQACHHCHVDAGPDRAEVMPQDVVDACLRFLELSGVPTLDITGGAPELHPQFRDIVRRARAMGRHVIDRCNLTVVTLPSYAEIPAFLADHRVEVVASLPAYAASQTDAQRGDGVFDASIEALRRFNRLGYGMEGSGLVLDLVSNPVGAFLPPAQSSLEAEWKRQLRRRYGVEFTRLFTITNMPISRFLEWLERTGNLQAYMDRLVEGFNPAAIEGLMCRTTLSVGWDGRLYDCDFNQMIELGVNSGAPATIFDATAESLVNRRITVGPHCFGCTAGAGSSCGGATVRE